MNTNFSNNEAANAKKGFKIHLAVCLLVSVLLTAINLTVCPAFLWFFFPIAGMGIGVAIHGIGTRAAKGN